MESNGEHPVTKGWRVNKGRCRQRVRSRQREFRYLRACLTFRSIFPPGDLTAGEWLKSKLLDSASTLTPACHSSGGSSEPFAVLAAVGDLHLNLDARKGGATYAEAVAMLNGITSVTGGTDMIVSDLGSQLFLADKGLPVALR